MDDLEPMMRIGHEGLRPHIEAFREWDQCEEDDGFRAHFEPHLIQIIEVGGEDAGYIKVESSTDHTYVDGIYIAKPFRSMGLGTQLLQDTVLQKANQPVRLRVFKTNPAMSLYARLGFEVIQTMAHAVLMEYRN